MGRTWAKESVLVYSLSLLILSWDATSLDSVSKFTLEVLK